MRHFFFRSKLLVLVFSMVAMLFTLGGMAYLKNAQVYKPFPQISDEGIIGNITVPYEKEAKAAFAELTGMLSNEPTPFLLAPYFIGTNCAAVYYSESKMFPIKLVEGRKFDERDFSNNANVVMVNSSHREECREHAGKLWWQYGGDEYEVVGIYDSSEDNAEDAFFNLTADNLSTDLFGDFVFDAGAKSASVFGQIASQYRSAYPDTFIGFVLLSESKGSEYVHEGATAFGAMELLLIATAILVLINAISIGASWLIWYEKEFSVRMLCGATKRKIQLWIAKRWLSFVIISEIIGILCAMAFLKITKYLPVSESVQLMFGQHIDLAGAAVGFLGLLFLCGIVIAVIISLGNKKTIRDGMR